MRLLACAVLFTLASVASAAGPDGFWLITPDEAAMPPASTEKGGQPFDAGRDAPDTGPLIEVLKPVQGEPAAVPLEIAVKFVPRSAPVDLSSLKVTVVKFLDIDITDRVRPFATPAGIQIPDARLPAGEHRVRITVADASGGVSRKQLTLMVP
jgi:hypothetical protein